MSAAKDDFVNIEALVAYFEAKNSDFDANKSKAKNKKESGHKKKTKFHGKLSEKPLENNAEVKTLKPVKSVSLNTIDASATKNPSKNGTRKRDQPSLEAINEIPVKSICLSSSSSSSSFGFNSPKVDKKGSNVLNVSQCGELNGKHKPIYVAAPEFLKEKVDGNQKATETLTLNKKKNKKKKLCEVKKDTSVKEEILNQVKIGNVDFALSLKADINSKISCQMRKKKEKKEPKKIKVKANNSTIKISPRKRGRPPKPKISPIGSSLVAQKFYNQPSQTFHPSQITKQTWQPSKLIVKSKLPETTTTQNESDNNIITGETPDTSAKAVNGSSVQFINQLEVDKMIAIKRRESLSQQNFNETGSYPNQIFSKGADRNKEKDNIAPLRTNVNSGSKVTGRRIYNKNLSIATSIKQPPTTKSSPVNGNIDFYDEQDISIENNCELRQSQAKPTSMKLLETIMKEQKENIVPIWFNEVSKVQQHQNNKKNAVTNISDVQLVPSRTALHQKQVDSLKSNVTSGFEIPLHQEAALSIANNLEQPQAKADTVLQPFMEEDAQDNFLQRKFNIDLDVTKQPMSEANIETKSQTHDKEMNASPIYANSDSDSGVQDQDTSLISFNIEQPQEAIKITADLFQDDNVIKILHAWVQTIPIPCDRDIDALSNGVCKLVKLGLYDKLYNGLLYLCRFINRYRNSTQFCYWHLCYKLLVACIKTQQWDQNLCEAFELGDELECKVCKL